MDHLPSVVSPFEPIFIPYLDGEEYDGLDFSGYPSRQSWQVDLLAKGFLQGRTALEGAQFLQAWLYFGMLHEALRLVEDDRIPLQGFIRFDDGLQRNCITTSQLPELLRNLHHRIKQMPDRSAYYERFRACMQRSCEVWRDLIESSDNGNTTQLLSHEILLSIQVLGAALDIGITEICGSRAEYTWRIVPQSKWLMQRMISQGWCCTVVEQLSKPCATFLYYASLLGPPRPGDDHSKCSANGRACLATNTSDGAEYKARHVLDSCNCKHISIPTGDGSPVADAIRSGSIPIILLKDDGEEPVIEIQEYSVSSPIKYTAISHVWSDGLGDPSGNTLPRCQLKRLGKLITALPSSPDVPEVVDCCFWIDTLCIPKDQALRNQAIDKMRDVYKLATNVLVLNTELMRASCNRPYTEIFTRITCSSWLRRLWTLQESLLNSNLLVQFSERAVHVGFHSRLYTVQQEDNTENPWDLVAWECSRYSFHILMHFPSYSDIMQINAIWDILGNRTTSRVHDEPLCIAILLDLNMHELQKAPTDDRVKKFWTLHVKGLPASVLFLPGEKLSNEGFGWAPADLMELKILEADLDSRAMVTQRGLQVAYPGFTLSQPNHSPSYVLSCQVDGATFFIRQRLRDGTPSLEGLNLHKCKSLALIILVVKGSAKRDFGGAVIKGTEETNASQIKCGLGVLVQGQWGWHSGERQVKYLRQVSVIRKGSFWDEHPALAWSQTELEEKERTPVTGVFLTSEQKWCIG